MLFNSAGFIFVFMPLAIAGFFVASLRFGHRAAMAWLVMASVFFYGWWNPIYLVLIALSIGFNYSAGLAISAARQQSGGGRAKLLAGAAIAANLLVLGYFKYAGFFVETTNAVAGTTFDIGNIVLLLAISFFTFQHIAYIVDTSKAITAQHDFLHRETKTEH